MFVVYLFFVIVVLTGGSAILKGAVEAGLAGIAGPLLCLFGAAGAKGSVAAGVRSQKIGGLVAGAVFLLVGLAILYASGYRVTLFGLELAGVVWGVVGAAIGLIFVPGSMALPRGSSEPPQPNPDN